MLTSGSLQERAIGTLGNVGSAVLNGGISTFLATMLLALSKSYVFRVLFLTFFFTVLLGMLHGMVLLPALLSLVGPNSYGGSHTPVVVNTRKVVAATEDEVKKIGA